MMPESPIPMPKEKMMSPECQKERMGDMEKASGPMKPQALAPKPKRSK